jgi:hypothetical protein
MTNAEIVEYFKQQAAQEQAVETELAWIAKRVDALVVAAVELQNRIEQFRHVKPQEGASVTRKPPAKASKTKRAGSVAAPIDVDAVRGVIALLPDGAIIKPKLIKEHCSRLGLKTIGAALRQIQQEDAASVPNDVELAAKNFRTKLLDKNGTTQAV